MRRSQIARAAESTMCARARSRRKKWGVNQNEVVPYRRYDPGGAGIFITVHHASAHRRVQEPARQAAERLAGNRPAVAIRGASRSVREDDGALADRSDRSDASLGPTDVEDAQGRASTRRRG